MLSVCSSKDYTIKNKVTNEDASTVKVMMKQNKCEAKICLRTLLNVTYLRGLMIVSVPFELCQAVKLMSLKFRGTTTFPATHARVCLTD